MKRKHLTKLKLVLGIIAFNLCFILGGFPLNSTFSLSILLCSNLIAIYVFYSLHHQYELFKESEEFVNSHLSIEKLTEVIPINSRNYQDFILNLPQRAKFYATKTQVGSINRIIIKLQFHEETSLEFFESLSSDDFMSFYKLAKTDN